MDDHTILNIHFFADYDRSDHSIRSLFIGPNDRECATKTFGPIITLPMI
jgi:hypothetical protein